MMKDLGRVVPILQGQYLDTQSYELNDIVMYNGSLFWHIEKDPTTGIAPVAVDDSVWMKIFDGSAAYAQCEEMAEKAEEAKKECEAILVTLKTT